MAVSLTLATGLVKVPLLCFVVSPLNTEVGEMDFAIILDHQFGALLHQQIYEAI